MNSREKVKKEMLSVRIPETLNRKLEQHVKQIGVSKAGYILTLIAKELDNTPHPAAWKEGR
jgi:hypothetical protein